MHWVYLLFFIVSLKIYCIWFCFRDIFWLIRLIKREDEMTLRHKFCLENWLPSFIKMNPGCKPEEIGLVVITLKKQKRSKMCVIKIKQFWIFCSSSEINKTYGRILKANSIWSPTRAKFCRLIVRLSVILLQLNLTKLKLEYL